MAPSESCAACGFPISVLFTTARTKPHTTPWARWSCLVFSWYFGFSFHSHGTAFQAKRLAVDKGIGHFPPGLLDDS